MQIPFIDFTMQQRLLLFINTYMKYPSGARNVFCEDEEWLQHCNLCSDSAEGQQNNSIYILFIYEPYSTVKSSYAWESSLWFCLCYKVCLNILCTCNILIVLKQQSQNVKIISINYSRINTVIFATSPKRLFVPLTSNFCSYYYHDQPGGQSSLLIQRFIICWSPFLQGSMRQSAMQVQFTGRKGVKCLRNERKLREK